MVSITRELVEDDPICDGNKNCLPTSFSLSISMISFIWSVISVVLETIQALGFGDKLKALAYIIPNFMVRSLILILILSFLNLSWTLPFLGIVLGINSLFLLRAGSSCQSWKCPEVFKSALT